MDDNTLPSKPNGSNLNDLKSGPGSLPLDDDTAKCIKNAVGAHEYTHGSSTDPALFAGPSGTLTVTKGVPDGTSPYHLAADPNVPPNAPPGTDGQMALKMMGNAKKCFLTPGS